jgi:hypothetical protein
MNLFGWSWKVGCGWSIGERFILLPDSLSRLFRQPGIQFGDCASDRLTSITAALISRRGARLVV